MATVASGYPAGPNASINIARHVTREAAHGARSDLGLQLTVARCPLRPVCSVASMLPRCSECALTFASFAG